MPKLIIDKEKLATLIQKSFDESVTGYWEAEEIVIGDVEGWQISIRLNSCDDDKVEEPDEAAFCVTEPPAQEGE